MNILLVNKFYFKQTRSGGVGTYVFGLQDILEGEGHQVIPWGVNEPETLPNNYQQYFLSPVKTKPSWNLLADIRTVGRFFWSFEARRRLKRLLKTEQIDLAHLNNIYHQLSPSFLPLLKKKNIPVVMTVHDYNLICPNYNLYLNGKEYKRAVGQKYYQCLRDRCVRNSWLQSLVLTVKMYLHQSIYQKNVDIFIAPSEFVRHKLLKAGYPEKKIRVLPHFLDLKIDPENLAPVIRQDYIFAFGRLSEEKGFHVLLEMAKKMPDQKIKIAGDGPERDNLEKIIKDNNLDNVELLGHLSAEEIVSHVRQAKLVVVPSLAPETFGYAVLESLALGATVLASRIGALTQFLPDQNLFTPGDAEELGQKIVALTEAQKNDMVNQINKQLLDEYSPEKYYANLAQIYQQARK